MPQSTFVILKGRQVMTLKQKHSNQTVQSPKMSVIFRKKTCFLLKILALYQIFLLEKHHKTALPTCAPWGKLCFEGTNKNGLRLDKSGKASENFPSPVLSVSGSMGIISARKGTPFKINSAKVKSNQSRSKTYRF